MLFAEGEADPAESFSPYAQEGGGSSGVGSMRGGAQVRERGRLSKRGRGREREGKGGSERMREGEREGRREGGKMRGRERQRKREKEREKEPEVKEKTSTNTQDSPSRTTTPGHCHGSRSGSPAPGCNLEDGPQALHRRGRHGQELRGGGGLAQAKVRTSRPEDVRRRVAPGLSVRELRP